MKIVPVNSMLLLEPYDKVRKKNSDSPFTSIVVSNNLGTVKYSGSATYSVGTQVYFAGAYEKIMMEGVEVIAIKEENVIAIVTE